MELLMRDATPRDSDTLLRWRNGPEVRSFSENQELISKEEHSFWFANRLSQIPNQPFWMFQKKLEPVGTVRLDFGPNEQVFRISILVAPLSRGEGYGGKMLAISIEKFYELHPEVNIRAKVHKENFASSAIFLKSEFEVIGQVDDFLIFERGANLK
jgi:RimJ/RimL family protein N-acetyltransferase